jgi:hypothetical protein
LATIARDQVVIGIDEMDKMESGEVAQQFLNEIKATFGVDNCFYLVSISEGAMSSFERRGLPFRDVFDSSFDEVIAVSPLTLANSKDLLRRRVVGLGPPFLDLCHCIAGGLPRDVLRAARRLSIYEGDDRSLRAVSKTLAIAELQRKVEAATVSARHVAVEPNVGELLFWLRALCPPEPTAEQLLQASVGLPRNWPHALPNDRDESDVERLEQTRVELAGFTYFIGTLVQFFAEFKGDPREHFERAEAGEQDGSSEIDELSRARAAFEVNASLAVSLVDAFRVRQGWTPVRLPLSSSNGAAVPEREPSIVAS